jgi:predicted nucleic acid-binding protein
MEPNKITDQPILLDTDVLVDFLRGHSKAVTFINNYSERIILSSITVAELYTGVRGEQEQAVLGSFISLFPIVPVNAEIAKKGGLLKRDYGRSHGVGLADAVIAATAETENATLKTLNIKHYPMLKRIRPAYTKDQSET